LESVKGLWWLPEKEQTKVPGILSLTSGQQVILSLDGLIEDSPLKELNKLKEAIFYEIILGKAEGEKVTLVNCKRTSYSHSLSGVGDSASSKFNPTIVCKGLHFSSKKDLKFSKIAVTFSHIRNWFGVGIHGIKREDDPYLKGFVETWLFVQILPNLSLEIPNFLERDNVKIFDYYSEKAIIYLSFPKEKLSVTPILEYLDVLRNFFQISIDEKIQVIEIEAREECGNVRLIIPTLTSSNINDRISFIPEPITLLKFISNAQLYLCNWFSFAEKYKPTYQLFFSDNYEQSYITTRFLSYAQAIESYHNRNEKYGNKIFLDSDLQKLIDQSTILDLISNKFSDVNSAQSVVSKFKWLNEKTLRLRLKELNQEYTKIFTIFIRDRDAFISRFVDVRNYYTHYDAISVEPSYKEMVVLTENARFILLSILLKEIGFYDDEIASAIRLYCRKRVTKIMSLEDGD
jgi:hypothetical protein